MSEFNLIDEPWIPVRFLDGHRTELGIRDTLFQSKEIAEIEDQSPLVVAALHRFLLAVLYRALEGPTDIDKAKELFRAGIPSEKMLEYLTKWRERFYVFDKQCPFAQNPNIHEATREPWTKLTAEYNGRSTKVLFDHTDVRTPGVRSISDCSRWLITTMSFSVSGGSGYRPSPEPNALHCIPIGRFLSETLVYNLVPYRNREVARSDSALWERPPLQLPLKKTTRPAMGYADLYTWQSRMILLDRPESGGIAFMEFGAGEGCEKSLTSNDPMQAYIEMKEKGRLPIRLQTNHPRKPGEVGHDPWRDFAALLPAPSGEGAQTVGHALRLIGHHGIHDLPSLLVIAQKNVPPNANLDYWRMERFVLPEEMKGERTARSAIEELLSAADNAERVLQKACWNFVRYRLIREERDLKKKEKERIAASAGRISAVPFYWAALEGRFHDVLRGYALGLDQDAVAHQWLSAVRTALLDSWRGVQQSTTDADVWTMRAFVKTEQPVYEEAAQLKVRIVDLESSEAIA